MHKIGDDITNMGGGMNYINCECITTLKKRKNLFNPLWNLISESDGLINTLNSDGSVKTVGTPTKNYASVISATSIDNILIDGQNYTISQQAANPGLYLQITISKPDSTNSYLGLGDARYKTFTVDKRNKYKIMVQTGIMASSSNLNVDGYYQLEKGSSATEFEPYTGE